MNKTYIKSTKEGVVNVRNTIIEEVERTLEDLNNDIKGLELRIVDLKLEKIAITNTLK